MQNGYHHTPNKGTPHCGDAKEKDEHKGGGGHHRKRRAASGESSHGICTTEDGGPVRWDGEEMPRRAITPGLHMGLSVTLNTRVYEEFCTSFQSSGFKGLLHVPISQPEMVEYGFALSPGTENFLDLNPKTIRAGGLFLNLNFAKNLQMTRFTRFPQQLGSAFSRTSVG